MSGPGFKKDAPGGTDSRRIEAAQALSVRREELHSPAARALIEALNAELDARYPEPGENHFRLDAEEVAPGRGAFLIGRIQDEAVACGAIRCLSADIAEIKRMYVAPALRGRGIARRILAALEQEARALRVTHLVLETADRQPEAIALYRRAGFSPIPRFGEYTVSTLSLCMGKDLGRSNP